MMWDWNGASWWSWFLMSGGMLVFWALVVWLVVQVARGSQGLERGAAATPEAVLADRLARGEIDADEYRARLEVLHGS
jgi:putative membrane protein